MNFKKGNTVYDFCFKQKGKVFYVEPNDTDYYGAVMVNFSDTPGSDTGEYFKNGKNLYDDISLCKGFFCFLKYLFFKIFNISCA